MSAKQILQNDGNHYYTGNFGINWHSNTKEFVLFHATFVSIRTCGVMYGYACKLLNQPSVYTLNGPSPW